MRWIGLVAAAAQSVISSSNHRYAPKAAPSPPYQWTLAPAAPPAAGTQAYCNNTMTSFGGGIVHWPDPRGDFHLFATAMSRGCGIHAWSSNAKVIHAVAHSVEGPYAWADDALPVLHAAPGIIRAPDGTFLLFSMGSTNSSLEVDCPGGEPVQRRHQIEWDVRLHSATSPYGPWSPVYGGPNGSAVLWRAVNPTPSPWVLSNGTVIVIGGGLYIAPHWQGPYIKAPGPPVTTGFNWTECN